MFYLLQKKNRQELSKEWIKPSLPKPKKIKKLFIPPHKYLKSPRLKTRKLKTFKKPIRNIEEQVLSNQLKKHGFTEKQIKERIKNLKEQVNFNRAKLITEIKEK